MESYIIIIVAIVTALASTYLMKKIATKAGIGTLPDKRKIHTGFVPHMGGLGIFLGGLAGLLVALLWKSYYLDMLTLKYTGILAGSVVMLFSGIFDDLWGLNVTKKFILQIIAASIVIYFGCKIDTILNPFGDPVQLGIWSIPLTYLWLIGITNAINLLDGLDGLAAGVSLIVLATFGIIAFLHQDWMTFAICLAFIGGLLGFLYFNYHPASIFMGDTGSLFIGFLIAAIAVKGLQKSEGNIALLVPIITLAVPIGDTTLAFFRRLYRGQHPFSPDRDHLHHRLLFLGLSHRQAVHIIYLFSSLFGLAAWLMASETGLYGAVVVLMIFLMTIFSLYRLGYLEAQKVKTYVGEQSIIQIKKEMAPLSMRRFWHKFLLILSDIFTLNLSLLVTYFIRFHSGLFENMTRLSIDYYITSGTWLVLTIFFVLLFALNGLYSMHWDVSRFDKVLRVSRVIVFGSFILFLITLDPERLLSASRMNILIFVSIVLLMVNTGRIVIIMIEKKFAVLEYALHNTLLIGSNFKAKNILKEVNKNPHLLYNVVGVIAKRRPQIPIDDLPYMGNYQKISEVIKGRGIEEVIIAIEEQSPDEILSIVAHGDNMRVTFKVIPEMYDVISGLKTEEMLGHPLIKMFAEYMLPWQWLLKRMIDAFMAAISLILLSPVFMMVILMQMLIAIRPIFKIEDRVGRHGKIFGLVQFNCGEEKNKVGDFLKRTKIFRLPMFLNVLIGSMSLVGPVAERKETVEDLKTKIRFYNRRFMIRPGMTGWAQLKVKIVTTLKLRQEQFQHDLFYLENMSLNFDMRIVIRALIKILFRKYNEPKN